MKGGRCQDYPSQEGGNEGESVPFNHMTSILVWPFLSFLTQTGIETASLPL